MSDRLVPCAGCGRHVKAGDEACPFCGGSVVHAPERPTPTARLGRAATFAFGAAIAAATTAGCGDSHGPQDDAGMEEQDAGEQDAGEQDAGEDAAVIPEEDAGGVAPPYGAPPEDAGFAPLYGGAPGD